MTHQAFRINRTCVPLFEIIIGTFSLSRTRKVKVNNSNGTSLAGLIFPCNANEKQKFLGRRVWQGDHGSRAEGKAHIVMIPANNTVREACQGRQRTHQVFPRSSEYLTLSTPSSSLTMTKMLPLSPNSYLCASFLTIFQETPASMLKKVSDSS